MDSHELWAPRTGVQRGAGWDRPAGRRSWHWEANDITRTISSKDDLTGRFSVKEDYCDTSPETGSSHTAAARPKGEERPVVPCQASSCCLVLLYLEPYFYCSLTFLSRKHTEIGVDKNDRKKKGSSHIQYPEHSFQYLNFSKPLIHLLNPH